MMQSQQVAHESEGADGQIAPARAPVIADCVAMISEEWRGPSLTVKAKDLSNLKVRLGLNIMVILKNGQLQK